MTASPYELLVGLALLRERKRQLDQAENTTLEAWSALTVRIGSVICLIHRNSVDEIISLESSTPVRGVAPWVAGLGYFRGQLLNLIDLKVFFSLGDAGYSPSSRILVVRGTTEWLGLRVDELIGIRHVWPDTVRLESRSVAKAALGIYEEQCLLIDNEPMMVLDIKLLANHLNDGGSEINTHWQTK